MIATLVARTYAADRLRTWIARRLGRERTRSSRSDASHGGAGRSNLPWTGGGSDLRGLPRRERYGLTARSQFGKQQMVMERRQFCGNLESDYRRRAEAEAISQPNAPHGRNTTHLRAGVRAGCIRLEPQPSAGCAHTMMPGERLLFSEARATERF